jgi:tRNA (mo5U34)-methyltransferase
MSELTPIYETLPCGTQHLVNPQPIDYAGDYWDGKKHSTLEEQQFNVDGFRNIAGETKVDCVLKRCRGKRLLEIACAPGCLLKRAREAGFEAFGVEPSERYVHTIEKYSGCKVFFGFFPGVDCGSGYDTVVAMDVLEHVNYPEQFVECVLALLNPGGRAIFMIPARLNDGLFDNKHLCFEHINIFSEKRLREWLKPTEFGRWMIGHEIIVVDKNQQERRRKPATSRDMTKLGKMRLRNLTERELAEMASIQWWHTMPIGISAGIVVNTCGHVNDSIDAWGVPSLAGKSVLDIGTWDGKHAFRLEQLGAKSVTAWDKPGAGWGKPTGFEFAKRVLSSRVEFQSVDIENGCIPRRQFDFVLFAGVLYHMRNPLKVLETVAKLCRKKLLLESAMIPVSSKISEPCLMFRPGYDNDPTNFFYPTESFILSYLPHLGFKEVRRTYASEDWNRMAFLAAK